ncbi:MAG TPA: hypothetical protein VNT55_25045, partial [Baekduia sp.]|nr:hypothetical protein [Baekduia sp.]
MIPRAIVAVAPAAAMHDRARLLAALAAAFPVDFVAFASDGPAIDGVLAIGPAPIRDASVPVLVLADAADPRQPATDVLLADDPQLDRRLRGVTLEDQELSGPIAAGEGEVVLASAGGAACWTRRPGPAPLDRVAGPVLELGDTTPLRDGVHRSRSLALVALVSFLRAVAEPGGVVAPPVRAAILFDDPNLRRPTYGHLNFAQLVRHADEHDYHASMAMIPLDRHLAHAGTVRLFRDRADRVSLAFHGNNHEKNELLQPAALPEALALCAQALRRVTRFEAAQSLPVSRVMTAPHGMCSPSTARALGALPFDGLCAIHPFPWREDPPTDRPLAGWDPATFVEGCAVLPRVPLDWGADGLALRAFLDHPIVLYGHHDDVAGGLEPLAEAAARVNRIGDVTWTSLGSIAETNHRVHVAGGVAIVRPFANRLRLTAPAGATALTVLAPSDGAEAFAGWSVQGGDGSVVPFGHPLARDARGPAVVRLHSRWETPPASIAMPRPRPWPAVRRVG